MVGTVAGITAPGFSSNRRFTNIEGGLRLANQMLSNSVSKYKYVILLTDGFPTTYTEKTTAGGRTYQGVDAYTLYDAYTKQTCIGTSYSDTAAIKARETAVSMKKAGIDIVCIGIDVGSQTIKQYHDQGVNGGYSIVERSKNVHPNGYEIGKASDKSGYEVSFKKVNVGGEQQITEYYYTYTLKYRVRLENETAGFVENTFTYTNDDATLTYDDPLGEEPNDPSDDDTTMHFPDPKVKGFLGELSFTKVNSAGTALRGAQFALSHDSNCSVCKQSNSVSGNSVHVHTKTVTSDNTGKVSFSGIPPVTIIF